MTLNNEYNRVVDKHTALFSMIKKKTEIPNKSIIIISSAKEFEFFLLALAAIYNTPNKLITYFL